MAPRYDILTLALPFSNPFFIVLSTIVILSILYVFLSIIYNLYFHPLSAFPGPKSHAATRIPYLRALLSGNYSFVCHELHESYGEVVRIAPDELSYSNGGAWRDIYGHRQGHAQMPKSKKFYSKPANGVDSLIEANDQDHSRYRRLISHAFSERALREQEPVLNKYLDLLVSRLHEKSSLEDPIDAVKWYNWTTFDMIGDLAFGESFGCLENATYHPWVSNIFSGIKAGAYMAAAKQAGAERLLSRFVPAKLIRARDDQIRMTSEKVQKRLAMGTERPDFWSSILRHNDEKGMTVPEMNSNADLLIVAGSETTATLLSGCTYQLLKNPETMQKLVTEIRTTFPKEQDINMISVNNLKYLLAVLDESLRMYPPVPSGLPRQVPGKGDFINETWVPGGTQVSVNQWATYRSKQNFKNPHTFEPSRWLGDPAYASDNKNALQPFSVGPRNCLGRNLAYAEMRLILTRVLWNFDLELCEVSKDWSQQKMYTLWEKPPLMVRLVPALRT